ncbi:Prefoldin subunit 3 [Smittium mucronatum]|uniref:Prefoldin subunit 3 n=1 Tax=Smittium mucronatum TaxID=133383 RepID=A0A1R0GR10_9FUNG|nr:Prefoldin subunit 3 [Smittium mucronatum]
MEVNTMQRRKGLEEKIPEIEKSLSMVEFIMNREDTENPIETSFELYDTLYTQAEIKQPDKVCLWLGANVMLEYTLEEAKDLLESKLKSAKQSLENAIEDLDFLREQITTMEVNTARTYNWDVKQRRLTKSA